MVWVAHMCGTGASVHFTRELCCSGLLPRSKLTISPPSLLLPLSTFPIQLLNRKQDVVDSIDLVRQELHFDKDIKVGRARVDARQPQCRGQENFVWGLAG